MNHQICNQNFVAALKSSPIGSKLGKCVRIHQNDWMQSYANGGINPILNIYTFEWDNDEAYFSITEGFSSSPSSEPIDCSFALQELGCAFELCHFHRPEEEAAPLFNRTAEWIVKSRQMLSPARTWQLVEGEEEFALVPFSSLATRQQLWKLIKTKNS